MVVYLANYSKSAYVSSNGFFCICVTSVSSKVLFLVNVSWFFNGYFSETTMHLLWYSIRRKPRETELDFDRVKRQLVRILRKKYPKLPKLETGENSTDLHKKYETLLDGDDIRKEFGSTLDKRHKYFGSVVKTLFAFHVFVSFTVIEMIKKHISKEQAQKRRYLMDGTFRVVPRKFNQLLIIAIEYKNDVRKEVFSFCSGNSIIRLASTVSAD